MFTLCYVYASIIHGVLGHTCTKQITKDDDGHRTEEQIIETYANIPPTKAAFKQTAGASTLTAVSADPMILYKPQQGRR